MVRGACTSSRSRCIVGTATLRPRRTTRSGHPCPGRVVVVRAAQGDKVVAGQELLVVEAMKMELALKAPRDGVVAGVSAAVGDFVEADVVLVALEH